MSFTLYQFLTVFGAVAFCWICYAVMTDQQAGQRDRDENSFDLFNFDPDTVRDFFEVFGIGDSKKRKK